MVKSPTKQLTQSDDRRKLLSVSRRVRQTRDVDVLGKGSQAVVSRSETDDKRVTRFVGEMTSPSAS